MRRKESLGSTIMVLQEQFNHQQRLHAIYSRNPHHNPSQSRPDYSHLHTSYSKKQQYDDHQHLRNIRQLVATLNRDKTIAERNKDPHDFFSYPALFFREVPKQPQKPMKKGKKLKKVRSDGHLPQEEGSKVSLERIRQFLPLLSNFDQSELEEVTDGINKMIISFDIITPLELRQLQDKVINLLPPHTPHDFLEAVAIMFEQIEQQMDQ